MERCDACGRTDGQRNVKIELEFWKQNSQYFSYFAHKQLKNSTAWGKE